MRPLFAFLFGLALSLFAACESQPPPTQSERWIAAHQASASLTEVQGEHALLSVYQVNEQVAFVVGGGVGPESGVVYRLENGELLPENVPLGPALWWVWGLPDGRLWACGDRGRILSRSEQGEWTEETTPLADDTILYGIWGDDSGHLWSVGGSYRRTGEQNIILTSSGNGIWERFDLITPPEPFSFFKIWGSDPTWIVGDVGWVLKIEGNTQHFEQSEAKEVLFTVHGQGDDVWAVGGQSEGQIYGLRRPNMIRDGLSGVGVLNGIYVREDGQRIAVGEGGLMLISSKTSQWAKGVLYPDRLGQRTIHGVSSKGSTLFVGGDLRRMNRGFLIQSTGFQSAEVDAL